MKQNNFKANFKIPTNDFTKQVKSYYEQDCSTWDCLQSCAFHEGFQNMIDTSIKSNNLKHLEILWQALYFYGTNPNFVADVYTVVEFGDLKTVLHVLWGYMNYTVMEDLKNLDFYEMKTLAVKNPSVLNFVMSLITATSNGQIVPCSKKCSQQNELGQEFYKCVEKTL